VTPAVQTSGSAPDSGFEYSINGVRPRRFRDQFADRPLKLWWTAVGDYVWLHDSTVYPPGLNAPRMQRKTNFIRRDHFLDPGMGRLPTMFTASVFQPWPAWMQMGDRPGHVVWHASGVKLKSTDEIPDEHRLRALEGPSRLPETGPRLTVISRGCSPMHARRVSMCPHSILEFAVPRIRQARGVAGAAVDGARRRWRRPRWQPASANPPPHRGASG
jgi:hypothetical protein